MLPCHHEALLRTGPVSPWDRHNAAVTTPVPLHVTKRIAASWLARDLAILPSRLALRGGALTRRDRM